MGRCVFFNLPGASGHINPTVGVVKELINRGEEVIYYAGEDSRAKFTALGAEFRNYEQWFDYHHNAETGKNILTMALAEIHMTLDCIEPLLEVTRRDDPDYIVYDSCCVWGKYIAQALNKPAVASITTLVSSPWIMLSDWRLSLHVAGVLVKGVGLITWGRRVGIELCEKIGVEFRGIFYHVFDFFACLGDLNIVFNTREYQPFANQLVGDFRFVGASIPDGRDAGSMKLDFFNKKKLVYVSLGTLHNQDLGFYRTVMDALADEDLNVMMSIGRNNSVADLGPIPDNFTVENFVPQLEVLKRADAFITHGGMNSLNEALYFGVPVIVVPQQVEQAFNARRLGRFGVSQSLGRKALTPEGIRRQVMRVLDDVSYKNSAIAYGRTLREAGGYKAAASAILAFARQRQPQQASAAQARRRA